MDVLDRGREMGPLMSGQVILSSPDRPCLWCCGFLTEERLRREAEDYGAAGGRPQVVWSNGVLASTAVSLVVQLLCPWHSRAADFAFLVYDGNRGTVVQSPWVESLKDSSCTHFTPNDTGDPLFDVRHTPVAPLQPAGSEARSMVPAIAPLVHAVAFRNLTAMSSEA